MRRLPKKRRVFRIVVLAFALLIAINIGARYIIAEVNYTYNKKNVPTTHLASSAYMDISYLTNLNYSLNHNPTTYTHVLASYNALKNLFIKGLYSFEGYSNSNTLEILPSMMRYYDRYGQLGFGHIGTNPFAVKWYFNSIGFKSEIYFNRNTIIDRVENGRDEIFILYTTDYKNPEFKVVETMMRASTGRLESMYRTNNTTSWFRMSNHMSDRYSKHFVALISINLP